MRDLVFDDWPEDKWDVDINDVDLVGPTSLTSSPGHRSECSTIRADGEISCSSEHLIRRARDGYATWHQVIG